MKPGGLRDRLRLKRLRFWLSLMAACERHNLTDCEIYYWFSRRASGCNAWRK